MLIDTSSRTIFSADDQEELGEAAKQFDIRHTAPQHRQYLEYEGIGSGTPAQRQKQFQQFQVRRATDSVHNFMVQKIVTQEGEHGELIKSEAEAKYARRWKVTKSIDRVVEDMIQESMRRGEFDNLPGAGKPLKHTNYNPFVDTMTHKINEIMVNNGFSPQWVLLEKEIKKTFRG